MRGKTLIPAALFGVAIAALALAQTTSTPSTAPANGETAAPAPPNTQPTAAKPPETSPEAAQGSGGGQGSTQATAPEPGSKPTNATSAPGGAPKEGATGPQPGRKPVTEHPRGARHASNVDRAHARVSPARSVDENASADQSLRDAHSALRQHNTQDAQEALERAETQVLNSVPEGNVSQNSTVIAIERAREALGHARYLRPDPGQAGQLIDEALAQTGTSSRPPASR
jgi:hypothetical protein